jgi:D-glycero-D-manno-heptose 1,7-bisphosphate phosphatase
MELRRGAFFDRDGVINASPPPDDYVRHWEEFRLLPEAVELIRRFNALDVPVIVVTNQRGVSRGLIRPDELERIHGNMRWELARRGARIDDIYVCPHEEDTCECRKPRPGLVLEAARRWDIDVPRSVLLGDSWRDRELARNCGMRFVEVREGHPIGGMPGGMPEHA